MSKVSCIVYDFHELLASHAALKKNAYDYTLTYKQRLENGRWLDYLKNYIGSLINDLQFIDNLDELSQLQEELTKVIKKSKRRG